jgi:membrane protein
MKSLEIKKACDFFKRMNDPSIPHYASSLSFHTILSLIPILLISLSIFTKMPSFQDYYLKIQDFIFNSLMPTQQDEITIYLNKFLQNTGNMGSTGLIFVLYVSIMFFLDYEKIISKIFKTNKRTLWHALSTYWTLLTMMPLGLAVSFYFSGVVQGFLSNNQMTSSINFLLFLPYLIIWFLFFTMYTISANITISKRSSLIASFVASSIWYISKTLFVFYVAYNKTYLSIYGSFSIVMFFFVWIYFSWIIYLYGAKLCYVLNEKYTKGREGQEKGENPQSDSQK